MAKVMVKSYQRLLNPLQSRSRKYPGGQTASTSPCVTENHQQGLARKLSKLSQVSLCWPTSGWKDQQVSWAIIAGWEELPAPEAKSQFSALTFSKILGFSDIFL
ncbi:hypothetical protein GOODEAATRI_022747 [Goodea atripinnis]|uniref:Uncharacterized protein n=1 Tax=Goodea atripinnis TaxID=208336 RepID=A0ABV0N3W3_9TELE